MKTLFSVYHKTLLSTLLICGNGSAITGILNHSLFQVHLIQFNIYSIIFVASFKTVIAKSKLNVIWTKCIFKCFLKLVTVLVLYINHGGILFWFFLNDNLYCLFCVHSSFSSVVVNCSENPYKTAILLHLMFTSSN